MKRIGIVLVSLIIILFSACNKKDDIQKTTSQKITGKWMVIQRTEEEYKPISTLLSSDVYNGNAGDSMNFKLDNNVYIYSDIDGNHVIDYELLNDQTIRIESEEWQITKLTDTELNLLSDDVDVALNERSLVKVVLKRP